MKPIKAVLLLLTAGLFSGPVWAQPLATNGPSTSGRGEFSGCYAAWKDNLLTVGNTRFERKWLARDGKLQAVSFQTKQPELEWLASADRAPGGTNVALSVSASTGRFGPVEAPSLRLELTLSGKRVQHLQMQVFPEADGVLLREEAQAQRPVAKATTDASPKAVGVENGLSSKGAFAETASEDFVLAPQHLKLIQVVFADQTDVHNELVSEREWLLAPNEQTLQLPGNLVCLENTLDGTGLVLLKLAPLPHARSPQPQGDFVVNARSHRVQATSTDYPLVTLAYQGGRVGRIAALQKFQRELRVPDWARDGIFLSNTWGDRSRDARINEAFILKEIEAGAQVGVDVLQIDDGWQKGRTKNSASKGGVWNGWWAADPQFWQPDAVRFSNGLKPVAEAARVRGMKLGLWFAPDTSNDATNWQRDAERILELYRELNVQYIKIDSLDTGAPTSYANVQQLFNKVLQASEGKVVFDLDVTAGMRPGYFGMPGIGPVFIENRYTDWHSYWPHQTLRNLWELSQYVDPLRLRVELLNNARNTNQYPNDPLAPARYRADTLFAMTLMANPLGWFEVSSLPKEFTADLSPIVARWKRERARLHAGTVVPVGAAPDGVSWTGFASLSGKEAGGYVLLFRELNAEPQFTLDIRQLFGGAMCATTLAGRGEAQLKEGRLTVQIPAPLDFLWLRLEPVQAKAL